MSPEQIDVMMRTSAVGRLTAELLDVLAARGDVAAYRWVLGELREATKQIAAPTHRSTHAAADGMATSATWLDLP